MHLDPQLESNSCPGPIFFILWQMIEQISSEVHIAVRGLIQCDVDPECILYLTVGILIKSIGHMNIMSKPCKCFKKKIELLKECELWSCSGWIHTPRMNSLLAFICCYHKYN